MNADPVELTMHGRRRSIFERLSTRSDTDRWAGFHFEAGVSNGEPMPSHHWSKTTLLYVNQGDADLRWKHRGVWRHDPIATGCVTIIKRDEVIQAARPSGPSAMMALQIDPLRLADFAPDLAHTIDAALVGVAVTQDARLAGILSAMIAEVNAGCASGRLFAESLSIALLSCLALHYTAAGPVSPTSHGLSAGQKRRVAHYVFENMADDISVNDLSAVVQMNPSTFARRFKQAFGVTPYRYVMRERVVAAKRLLTQGDMTTNQIATELGFASQSHLLKVFRQFVGATPRQFRAEL